MAGEIDKLDLTEVEEIKRRLREEAPAAPASLGRLGPGAAAGPSPFRIHGAEGVDLRFYINMMLRQWIVELAVFLLVMGIAFFLVLTRPPKFVATAKLRQLNDINVALERGASAQRLSGKALEDMVVQDTLLERAAVQILPEMDMDRGQNLLAAVTRVEAVGNGDVLYITATHSDGKLAERIANGLAKVFIGYRAEAVDLPIGLRKEDLHNKEEQLRACVEGLKGRIGQLAGGSVTQEALEDLTAMSSGEKLTALRDQYQEELVKKEEVEIVSRITGERLQRTLDDKATQQRGYTGGSAVVDDQILKLRLEREKLLTHYHEAHPQIQSLDDNIKRLEEMRERIIRTEASLAGADPTVLRTKVTESGIALQTAQTRLDAIKGKMEQLERLRGDNEFETLGGQAATLRKAIGSLRELIDELERLKQRGAGRWEQYSVAEAGNVSRNPMTLIVLGMLFGALFGIGAGILREHLDDRIKTPHDIARELQLETLGVIPLWPAGKNCIVSTDEPNAAVAEVTRILWTNIRYSAASDPQKLLMVASAVKGEGKSTIAANLAISYGLEGNSVVMIDADLRRPRGHKVIEFFPKGADAAGAGGALGLSDYLEGSAALDEVISATGVEGLSLISAGHKVKNPSKLLGNPRMLELFDQVQKRFDVAIIDAPAVLPIVDATVISSHVRGVLLVVAAERVRSPHVHQALGRLLHVGSPVIGAVLNKVRVRSYPYRSYYGYGYRYGYKGYYGWGGYESDNDNGEEKS